ncbi:MAG: sigma-70 family RNA polymerase sigma factor [Phycisphaerae bacterium]|nr:sigma-70 family RNA polymerase sigma factor [Phycisphaerae bacterium]
MIWSQELAPTEVADASQQVALGRRIARRLKRRYGWIDREELYSYALWGVVQAKERFDPDRGVAFEPFASRKGMYLAIDEMRKDGLLRRANSNAPLEIHTSAMDSSDETADAGELPDPTAEGAQKRFEAREACRSLLGRLPAEDRRLLMLYYSESMTFAEIAEVFEISESAVCLRHKAVLHRLRRLAGSAAGRHAVAVAEA